MSHFVHRSETHRRFHQRNLQLENSRDNCGS